MLSAKFAYTVNNMLVCIGVNDDEGFSLFVKSFFTHFLAKMGGALFGTSFIRGCFSTVSVWTPNALCSNEGAGFRSTFFASPGYSRFFDGFERILYSKVRASGGSDVVSILPKWLKFFKPM